MRSEPQLGKSLKVGVVVDLKGLFRRTVWPEKRKLNEDEAERGVASITSTLENVKRLGEILLSVKKVSM